MMRNVPQDVDALAQEIRRVDGSHSLGAAALAEALMPFIDQLRAQRSNAEPVYQVQAWDGNWITVEKDSYEFVLSRPENTQKTRILYSAPPDAGFAAGMMKAAEILQNFSSGFTGKDLAEHIRLSIPADSKAALREVCMKVAGKMMHACTDFYYGKTTLEVSTQDIVNSVLEGESW